MRYTDLYDVDLDMVVALLNEGKSLEWIRATYYPLYADCSGLYRKLKKAGKTWKKQAGAPKGNQYARRVRMPINPIAQIRMEEAKARGEKYEAKTPYIHDDRNTGYVCRICGKRYHYSGYNVKHSYSRHNYCSWGCLRKGENK